MTPAAPAEVRDKADVLEHPRRPPLWRRPRYRALQRAQRTVWGRVFVDRGGDQRDTVWVVGGGKSGTTWIAEFINHRNDHRYMFEPLTPPYVPEFAHFRRGQYLRPAQADPRFADPMRALLTGRLRNRWADHLNCAPVAERRLIKDVHANLLLRWAYDNLPGVRIVMVIRHPLAVIVSRMDTAPVVPFHEFDPEPARFLEQQDLVDDFLAPHVHGIAAASTLVEQHAYWWCIENVVPLRQFRPGEIHIVCYEHLRWNPEREVQRLAAYLGTDLSSAQTKLRRPSRTAGYGGSLSRGVDPGTAWTKRVDSSEVRAAMRIVSAFGLDELYGDDPRPRVDDISKVMAAVA
ncbi:MAG: sulfotransferase domain-containing protein [Candidatus Dormibacteraeota bacterium]|nr:sulfotransferase domain-containing protein [Candidatus Dormibacteraeota bacterium]MBV9525541.1 sulfotransferase domain-containing protein [Candidatus Dormibacteraeota bacterium]